MRSKDKQKALDLESRFDQEDEELEEQAEEEQTSAYRRADLAGITVGHDYGDLMEGQEIILTLADADVLDDSMQPTLESSKLRQLEMDRRRKKAKDFDPTSSGYNANEQYEQMPDGSWRKKALLSQYDDKEASKFTLTGQEDKLDDRTERKRAAIRRRLEEESKRTKVVLGNGGGRKIASDVMSKEEMAQLLGGRRRKKKKGKKKKGKGKKLRSRGKTKALIADLLGDAGGDDEDTLMRGDAGQDSAGQKALDMKRKREMIEKERRYQRAVERAMLDAKTKLYGHDTGKAEKKKREKKKRKKKRKKGADAAAADEEIEDEEASDDEEDELYKALDYSRKRKIKQEGGGDPMEIEADQDKVPKKAEESKGEAAFIADRIKRKKRQRQRQAQIESGLGASTAAATASTTSSGNFLYDNRRIR